MNDIRFQPGDKVMRVGDHPRPDLISPIGYTIPENLRPKLGEIYCVKAAYESPSHPYQVITLVGLPEIHTANIRRGWPSPAFRKVSEIQLFARALQARKLLRQVPSEANPVSVTDLTSKQAEASSAISCP